jgi:hypothetical protein
LGFTLGEDGGVCGRFDPPCLVDLSLHEKLVQVELELIKSTDQDTQKTLRQILNEFLPEAETHQLREREHTIDLRNKVTRHREFKQNQQAARKKLTVEKLHLPLVHDHHATCSRISITENKNPSEKWEENFRGRKQN